MNIDKINAFNRCFSEYEKPNSRKTYDTNIIRMTFHLLRYVTLILRKVAIPLLLPLNLKAELANLFIFLKGGHYIFDRDLNAI